jgi:hypothetical protein
LEVPRGILCILESSSWDFVHFWKLLIGLCIFQSSSWDSVHFGSSSWDFVHYSKPIMGFCAFSEDPGGIVCIFGSSSWDFVHFWNFLMAKHTHVHFILSLFLYKICVFTTCILIDCGYRWLQPVQNVIL